MGGIAYVVSSVIVNHADWRLGLPVIPKGLMVSPVVPPKQSVSAPATAPESPFPKDSGWRETA